MEILYKVNNGELQFVHQIPSRSNNQQVVYFLKGQWAISPKFQTKDELRMFINRLRDDTNELMSEKPQFKQFGKLVIDISRILYFYVHSPKEGSPASISIVVENAYNGVSISGNDIKFFLSWFKANHEIEVIGDSK